MDVYRSLIAPLLKKTYLLSYAIVCSLTLRKFFPYARKILNVSFLIKLNFRPWHWKTLRIAISQ